MDDENEGAGGVITRNVAFNKQSVTTAQVHTLLGIISNANMVLMNLPEPDEDGGSKDGGIKCALETTILHATNRLDSILTELHRWDTKGVDSISKSVRAVQAQQLATLKAQQNVVEEELRPALIFKPQIFIRDGKWVAIHGEDTLTAVVGTGRTPYEAIKAFEKAYYTNLATGGTIENE